MKFGKLDDISGVDFPLRPDPAVTTAFLESQKSKKTGQVYLGATGWSMRDWVGKWYPPKTKPTQYLDYYSKQFGTIEFNSSYYTTPKPHLVARWVSQTPPNFRFCPKVLQYISHYRKRQEGPPLQWIEEWMDAVLGFGDRLGCLFIQWPPSISPEQSEFVFETARAFTPHLVRASGKPIYLLHEFRHPDWFGDPAILTEVGDVLAENFQGLMITDVSGRRDVCHMVVTTPVTAIRWVGNGLEETDRQRLNEWSHRLQKWWSEGLEHIYFFCHEPENLLAPEASVYLGKQLADLSIPTVTPKEWNPDNATDGQLRLLDL